MDYKHAIARSKNSITFQMLGDLGSEINGHALGSDIANASQYYDEITLHINSYGGNVHHGFSVASALLASTAKTHVVITGVAASMASVVAVCADKVSMFDFARFMKHNPYYEGKAKLNEKDKAFLAQITQMLVDVYTRRGLGKEDVEAYMKKETWFDSEGALSEGLIDAIIPTKKSIELSNSLPYPQMVAKYQELQDKPKSNMKNLLAKMNLSADASENAALQAYSDLVARAEKAEGKVSELEKENEALKAEADKAKKDKVVAMVKKGVEDGIFKEDKEEFLVAEYQENPEALQTVIDSVQPKQESVMDFFETGGGGKNKGKDWDWLQKNDPEALAELETKNPKLFNKLRDEHYANL